ncbi:MAG: response regulator, partial [Kiritimatiellae bacterium]|nr:response regulator [Kiritimatiellia bacterium]
MEQNKKILFVDDDENVLDAMKRNLRRAFDVHTAAGGEAGLRVIQESGPFAVVVSDMSMPGMDGAAFLAKVCELAPDTVRIMLTGQADLHNAMAAVNEGNIFRFVTKPADPKIMARAMKPAFDQYQLITAERNLLEETLNASVQVLVDMLSITNPAAFSQTMRVKDLTMRLAERLELKDRWQLELAALLSQLGAVTVPVETMSR